MFDVIRRCPNVDGPGEQQLKTWTINQNPRCPRIHLPTFTIYSAMTGAGNPANEQACMSDRPGASQSGSSETIQDIAVLCESTENVSEELCLPLDLRPRMWRCI
jgi:hypothetical protein